MSHFCTPGKSPQHTPGESPCVHPGESPVMGDCTVPFDGGKGSNSTFHTNEIPKIFISRSLKTTTPADKHLLSRLLHSIQTKNKRQKISVEVKKSKKM